MIYLIVVITLVLCVCYYVIVLRRKMLAKKVIDGVDMVRQGVQKRLSVRFKSEYGQEQARTMAALIAHVLLAEIPSTPPEEDFLESHKDVIQKELARLQNDSEICKAVGQAIHAKAFLATAKGMHTKESLLNHIERLAGLGIMVPKDEVPSPSTFMSMAREFYRSAQKSSQETRRHSGA